MVGICFTHQQSGLFYPLRNRTVCFLHSKLQRARCQSCQAGYGLEEMVELFSEARIAPRKNPEGEGRALSVCVFFWRAGGSWEAEVGVGDVATAARAVFLWGGVG